MTFDWMGLEQEGPIIVPLPLTFARIMDEAWRWHSLQWRMSHGSPAASIGDMLQSSNETLRASHTDATRQTMTFGNRASAVEDGALARLIAALHQDRKRGIIVVFPANTTILERPFLKKLTSTARDTGRTLVHRHVFFQPSQTWWTLLIDDTFITELDGDDGFRTSAQAGVTCRGGDNGDFGQPEVPPENTGTGVYASPSLWPGA